MKIAVCGKGGCGKSTITTLLGKEFAKQGKEVLIVDSDESNYGLHCQLGMKLPKDFTGYFGGKKKALEDMMLSNFTHQFFNGAWGFEDIPEGYFEEKDNLKLMSSGKIQQANEGCACTMGNVISQFIMHLKLEKNQVAIMDMEAGIEHFGRGIDNGVDKIVVIIDPSYESLRLSKKITELAESIGKPVYYVLNKVTEENEALMLDAVRALDKVAASIPQKKEIAEAGLRGNELVNAEPEVKKLAERLLSNRSRCSVL